MLHDGPGAVDEEQLARGHCQRISALPSGLLRMQIYLKNALLVHF